MMLLENKPNNELLNNELLNSENNELSNNEIQCAICQDILVRPVTLLCQHTFCRYCIESYTDKATKDETDEEGFQVLKDRIARCPLCKCVIVVPPNDNFVLCDLLEKHYSQEYQKALEERTKSIKKKNVENQLRKELFNALVEETIVQNPPSNLRNERTVRMYYNSPYTDTWLSRFIEKYKYLVGIIAMIGVGIIVWKFKHLFYDSIYIKSILTWIFMANYLGFFG